MKYHTLNYCKDTGIFTRNGNIAGFEHKSTGYIRVRFKGKQYQAHRLAWYFHYGEMPNKIDHINRNKSDNRICNLRNVGYIENNRNASKRHDNSSGVTGISWQSSNSMWKAKIGNKYIGVFKDKDKAIAARKKAEAELGYLN